MQRRSFLKLATFSAVAPAVAAVASDHDNFVLDANASAGLNAKVKKMLEEIKTTNAYYTQTKGSGFFEHFKDAQHPRATLVGCSDSRFQINALDGSSEDDIFVVRNIGNQLIVNEGSIEYGVHHLHTPLLIIMGHTRCGAVKAAMSNYASESAAIRREVDHLSLPMRKYAGLEANSERWLAAVIENVHFQVKESMQSFASEIKSGKLTVVGLVFDLANDMKMGYGKIVPINLNGESNEQKLKSSNVLKPFFEG
jgi:carbonic anhydrase